MVPELMAMGVNKGQAPPKNQSLKPSPVVSEPVQAVVPAGTPIKIQLNQPLRTSTHRNGQSFFATLKEPMVIKGLLLVPAGVPLIGVISQSRESGHFSGSALIELQLTRIILPDGTTLPIATETFTKTGRAHLVRNIGLIAVGSILGAGLGNLLGKIPAALIGIGFGGGVGAVLAYVTGKEDLFVRGGTDLDFKVARPFSLLIQPSSASPSK
ncbi:MAG: hypothetical protein HY787_03800 [Deltaproteobacteria bacterium]|nr:hypothetical protein [Deltaproteobacteria bacterium]